jgi:RNA polymerase sigma-70 factor, ECF subfamily
VNMGGDQGLVARASRGDVDAFTKLVKAHSGLVYRVSLRMLGSDDAQDARSYLINAEVRI